MAAGRVRCKTLSNTIGWNLCRPGIIVLPVLLVGILSVSVYGKGSDMKFILLLVFASLSLAGLAQTPMIDPATGLPTDPNSAAALVKKTNGLDRIIAQTDLVFKGRVISSRAESNAYFPSWGKPHATKFHLVTVLKGDVSTNALIFWHCTEGPNAWGGGAMPSWYQLEIGKSYLVFARRLDKEDYLFTAVPDAAKRTNECRQLYRDGVIRTLDDRPLSDLTISNAVWVELNRLLNDASPSNQLYAIETLDGMSREGWWQERGWAPGDFLNREAVLRTMIPLMTNINEQIACRAIDCFATPSNPVVKLAPFSNNLIQVANTSPSSKVRLTAIVSLSGIECEAVSNSLAFLLNDSDENIRAGAIRLLSRFPQSFAEHSLRKGADDQSPNVRSVVADVIGDVKYENLLPILVKLFNDPVGKTNLIKPLTIDYLKAGQRWSNIGDVHTSAGMALVKFPPNQVAGILKSNLDDPGFHINFVAKLAQGDTEPWLPELASILELRMAYVDDVLKSPWDDPRRFSDPSSDRILTGTYTKCWEDIRQYLLKQSPADLASGKYDEYLDLLEKTIRTVPGCSACCVQPARWLYELLWTKGLTKRVGELRQKYDKTDGWWFDDFNQRGEAAQVNPIEF